MLLVISDCNTIGQSLKHIFNAINQYYFVCTPGIRIRLDTFQLKLNVQQFILRPQINKY